MRVGARAYFSRYVKHFLDSHEWRRWIGQNGEYPCRHFVPGVIWRSWFLASQERNLAFDWSGCDDLMTHSWNFAGLYEFLASLRSIMHLECRRALLSTFVNVFVILIWCYAENSDLFCYKTLHVSGVFSAHHQEFSTVHSALVSFVQVWWPFPSRVRME